MACCKRSKRERSASTATGSGEERVWCWLPLRAKPKGLEGEEEEEWNGCPTSSPGKEGCNKLIGLLMKEGLRPDIRTCIHTLSILRQYNAEVFSPRLQPGLIRPTQKSKASDRQKDSVLMAKSWPLESTKARVTLICLGMKNVLLCRSRKLSTKKEDVMIKEVQEMLEKLADEELKLMTLESGPNVHAQVEGEDSCRQCGLLHSTSRCTP